MLAKPGDGVLAIGCEEQPTSGPAGTKAVGPSTAAPGLASAPTVGSGVAARGVDAGVVRWAVTADVPLVTAQWVVQSLIHHRIVGALTHPAYQIRRR